MYTICTTIITIAGSTCFLITPMRSFMSSIATGTMLKLAAIGEHERRADAHGHHGDRGERVAHDHREQHHAHAEHDDADRDVALGNDAADERSRHGGHDDDQDRIELEGELYDHDDDPSNTR